MITVLKYYSHLYDVVHMWQETIKADFQQHDQSSADILPYFWLIICRQCKQIL